MWLMLMEERSGLKVNLELERRYTYDCLTRQESRLAARNRKTYGVKCRSFEEMQGGAAHRPTDPLRLPMTCRSLSDSFGWFTFNDSPFTIDAAYYSNTACSPIARLTASNSVCAWDGLMR